MESSAPLPGAGAGPGTLDEDVVEAVEGISRFWWLWLLFGIAWCAIAVVILQFDQASMTTVGIIVGIMFLATGLQSLVAAAVVDRHGWIYAIFGVPLPRGRGHRPDQPGEHVRRDRRHPRLPVPDRRRLLDHRRRSCGAR